MIEHFMDRVATCYPLMVGTRDTFLERSRYFLTCALYGVRTHKRLKCPSFKFNSQKRPGKKGNGTEPKQLD